MATWREAAKEVEEKLREFLGLEDTVSVIYLNRASAGIKIALRELNSRWYNILGYQSPTYNAIPRIATSLPLHIINHHGPVSVVSKSIIYAPVALGGEAIKRMVFDYYPVLLYDCAQTCYLDMFKGIFLTDTQYAVLSFEETKPMGTISGGGAIICHKCHEEDIRNVYVPGNYFFNPRRGQCMETFGKLTWKGGRFTEKCQKDKFNRARKAVEKQGYRVYNDYVNAEQHNIYTHLYVWAENRRGPPDVEGRIFEPYANNELWRTRL